MSASLNRLLIIKNDAIGDYILFRNFAEALKKAPQFAGYDVYILTTPKIIPLIQALDPGLYKEVIPFGYKTASTGERIRFFFRLKAYKFKYVIQPTFSPDWLSQELIKYASAEHKIGFKGDGLNLSEAHKTYFDQYYTEQIDAGSHALHEFDKQKAFFSQLLKHPLAFVKPSIDMDMPLKKTQVTVCPGAQAAYRRWSAENFRQMILGLHKDNPQLEFVVVTGPGEEHLYSDITAGLPFPVKQLSNADFITLCQVLKQSRLVVCNDSAPAHFSVALDVVNICISNGNHYQRFVPYPAGCHARQTVLVPAEVLAAVESGANPFYHGSSLDINSISYTTVLQACQHTLND